jgi:hypothetical protein
MDKKLNFTGIDPDLREDQIAITQDANRGGLHASLNSLAVGTNPNFIVSGCAVTVGGSAPNNTWSLAAGYIYLNGELTQVDAQSGNFDSGTQFLAFSKSTTYDSRGDKVYLDGNPRQTWEVNRGVITVKGSVLNTELDAINGDGIDDKLREYVGDASTTVKGFAQIANTTDLISNSSTKLAAASAFTGTNLQSNLVDGDVTLSNIDSDITTFYGLKRLQFEGNIAYSNSILPKDSLICTVPSANYNPAPARDIYTTLFIQIGGGSNDWTALKVKYTTSRELRTLEASPSVIASTNPFHINVVY